MSSIATPIVVGPGQGRVIPRPETGGAVTIKLSSRETGGAITTYESARAAGDRRGPAIHSHPEFDEMFYVLRGDYEFTVGAAPLRASEGSVLFVPRGVFHSFRSAGEQDARMLTICSPGGIEYLFEELARRG